MKKENARPHKAETSAVEQRQFTPAAEQKSRVSKVIMADFDGAPVSFTSDAWINGTGVAKRHGKRLDHWLDSKETKEYTAELAVALKYPNSGYLVRTRRGRGGTWMHPKLAVRFTATMVEIAMVAV